jgi:hypothetical protein
LSAVFSVSSNTASAVLLAKIGEDEDALLG